VPAHLVAAIEAMPQAFALWDEQERLVLCNGRFRRLYPGLEEVIRPGLAYAEFARIFSRSPHLPGLSEEERADWVARRVA
jgi:PAS domain-containing protein